MSSFSVRFVILAVRLLQDELAVPRSSAAALEEYTALSTVRLHTTDRPDYAVPLVGHEDISRRSALLTVHVLSATCVPVIVADHMSRMVNA